MARINSKRKGSNGERECCEILNERFGYGKKIFAPVPFSGAWAGKGNRVTREDMSSEQKATLSGDIITPPNFKFSIEHKAYKEASFFDLFNESSNLKEWFKQCLSDAEFSGKNPMLIVKYNNKKRIVYVKEKVENYVFEISGWHCLYLEDLLKLPNEFFFGKLS